MPIRSRLWRPSRIVVVVFVVASSIAWLAAINGFAPPAVTLTAGVAPATDGPDELATAGDTGAPADTGATSERRPAMPVGASSPARVDAGVPALHSAHRATVPTHVRTPFPVDELSGYRWPLKGRLTLDFGPTPWGGWLVDGERVHDGIDLATFCGDSIRAAHDGIVLAAGRHFDDEIGWIGDLGPYYRRLDRKQLWGTLPIVVVIDDGNGYRSIYAHFSKVTVKKGQQVRAGQQIGFEGATGRASGCHLHYGLFSPYETERMGLRPDTAKRMKLPRWEIARVDPLLVLPYRRGISPDSMQPGS